MIKEIISAGRTVDAAIDYGCEQLGVDRGDIDFEIISMPRKGFFGLSQTPARVRVFIEVPDPKPAPPEKVTTETPEVEEKADSPQSETFEKVLDRAFERPQSRTPAPVPAQTAEKLPDQTIRLENQPTVTKVTESAPELPRSAQSSEKTAQTAEGMSAEAAPCDFGNKVALVEGYINDILRAMKLPGVTAVASTRDNVIHVRITGDVSGIAIGRHGETLDALQYLVALAANRGDGDYVRIVLDSGNYRDKRRVTLEQLAARLGAAVLKTGRRTTLEPMNPYERRIIHSTISEMEGLSSASIGSEPNRCVVISATNPVAGAAKTGTQVRSGPPARSGSPSRPAPPARSGPRPPRRDGGRDSRPPRDRPAPYQESGTREVAPSEAQDQPLYGKIEL